MLDHTSAKQMGHLPKEETRAVPSPASLSFTHSVHHSKLVPLSPLLSAVIEFTPEAARELLLF